MGSERARTIFQGNGSSIRLSGTGASLPRSVTALHVSLSTLTYFHLYFHHWQLQSSHL